MNNELPNNSTSLIKEENAHCIKRIGAGFLLCISIGFCSAVAMGALAGCLIVAGFFASVSILTIRERNKRVRRIKAMLKFKAKHPSDDLVVL